VADEKEKQDKKKPAARKPAAKKAEGGAKPAAKPRARSTAKASEEKAPAKPRARKPAAAKAQQKPEAKAESKAEPKPAARPRTAAKKPAPKAPAAKSEAPAKAEAPKPKPAPAREARTPERPVVRAQAKYVRSSARKARLVMDHVRGRPVTEARAMLRHNPRGVARDVERLLASAIANAENNHDLVGDDLYVKEIYADEGPTLRRFRARAQGRATRIRKRTSHLTVRLSTRE
jgi:ribosomal protein L22